MPKFSANLGFLWPELPFLARIEAAAAAGFAAIEMHWHADVTAQVVREACAKHCLELVSINTPFGDLPGDFGLGAVPGREADFRAAFDVAAKFAKISGAGAIHVMVGVVPPEQRVAGTQTLRTNLTHALQATKDTGVTLLLEAINPRDKPDYFYHRIEDAAEIVHSIAHPRLGLMFDCYHVQVGQGDVLRRLEHFMPLIRHVQIAAAPSRAEPDEGELFYPTIFERLDQLGYEGWTGCEYRPRQGTDEGLAWVSKLRVALGK